jgi:hypothetical protein
MENENKIVKVYSNNSKKSRLKRNKNKFQRIWDSEKQTYIKVRKAKYPVKSNATKKDWREVDSSAALERRHITPKKPKSVPVNATQMSHKLAAVHKPETKQQVHKEPARVHGKTTTTPIAKIYKIGGVDYNWDNKSFQYKRAA